MRCNWCHREAEYVFRRLDPEKDQRGLHACAWCAPSDYTRTARSDGGTDEHGAWRRADVVSTCPNCGAILPRRRRAAER